MEHKLTISLPTCCCTWRRQCVRRAGAAAGCHRSGERCAVSAACRWRRTSTRVQWDEAHCARPAPSAIRRAVFRTTLAARLAPAATGRGRGRPRGRRSPAECPAEMCGTALGPTGKIIDILAPCGNNISVNQIKNINYYWLIQKWMGLFQDKYLWFVMEFQIEVKIQSWSTKINQTIACIRTFFADIWIILACFADTNKI